MSKINEIADKLGCLDEQVEALNAYLKANNIDISKVDISVDNNTFNVGGCYIEVIHKAELHDKICSELHDTVFTHCDMDFIIDHIDEGYETDMFGDFCAKEQTDIKEFEGVDVFIDGEDLTCAIIEQFEDMSAKELTKHLNDNDIEIDEDILKEEGLMSIAVSYYTKHPALSPNAKGLIDEMKLMTFMDKLWDEKKRDFIEDVLDNAQHPTNYIDFDKMAKHIIENTPRDCASDLYLNDYHDTAFEYDGYFVACDRNIKEMKINKPSLNDVIKDAQSKSSHNKPAPNNPNKEKSR